MYQRIIIPTRSIFTRLTFIAGFHSANLLLTHLAFVGELLNRHPPGKPYFPGFSTASFIASMSL